MDYESILWMAPVVIAVLGFVAMLKLRGRAVTQFSIFSLVAVILAGGIALDYGLRHRADLPQRVPVHFDINGNPDGWSSLSASTLWLLPIMTVVMGILIGGMGVLINRSPQLGLHRRSKATPEQLERFRSTLSVYLGVTALLTGFMMSILHVLSLRAAMGWCESIGRMPLVWVGAMLVFTMGTLPLLMIRSRSARKAAGAESETVDPKHWKAGVFYYNPDNPSFLVEKRFGMGYTINFSHRFSFVFIVLLLAILLLPFLLR